MLLGEAACGVGGEPKFRAEGSPVGRRVDVGVFDDDDGLALAGVAGAKEWGQVVDGSEVAGDDSFIRAAAGGVGVVRALQRGGAAVNVDVRGLHSLLHGVGKEVVEADYAGDHTDQSGGDGRIHRIGDVRDAVDGEVVQGGMEGRFNCGCGAGEVNHHAVGIDLVHGEAVGLEPAGDGGDVRRRGTVLLAKLLGGEPLVKVGRVGVVERGNIGGERRFALGRALQLQQHMVQREGRIDGAKIVGWIQRRGAKVAGELGEAGIVNFLRDDGIAQVLGEGSGGDCECGEQGQPGESCREDAERGFADRGFADHGCFSESHRDGMVRRIFAEEQRRGASFRGSAHASANVGRMLSHPTFADNLRRYVDL